MLTVVSIPVVDHASLPPQEVVRANLDGGSPYRRPEYREVLRSLCDGELTCAHCGLQTDHETVRRYWSDVLASEEGPVTLPGAEDGYELFAAAPVFPEWSLTDARLLCVPCWHAANMFLGGASVVGRFGLVPVLSQADVVNMWRAMMLGAQSGERLASQLKGSLQTFYGNVQTGLLGALGVTSGALTVTSTHLSYWAAYCPSSVYEEANRYLNDLRFLPLNEWMAYGHHLAFCRFSGVLPAPTADGPAT